VSAFWRGAFLAAFGSSLVATCTAAPLPEFEVRSAMAQVETLMSQFGIDVPGYALSKAPQVEWAPPDHPYVQGDDGAYVDGHIYINKAAIAACVDLTLVHELVHDATVKGRLFTTVANDQVHDVFEALADAITETAAQDPYLPGCLPHRHFSLDRNELVSLATKRNPPSVGIGLEIVAALPEVPAEGLAMLRCRAVPGDTCIALPPPL
jgi:hypothetical protein